ncbi:MAG TPA: adenylate/guanylate cyclase domain-containing protein [Yeosuana sp.]
MNLRKKAYYVLIGFFCSYIPFASGQNQKVADSLAQIYLENNLEGEAKMVLLKDLSFNQINDYQLSLKYAEELISLAELENNYRYLADGLVRKGSAHDKMGNLEMALNAFFKSAEIAKEEKFVSGEGIAYVSIADVYTAMNNPNNAISYYNKAIQLFRDTNYFIELASALLNQGDLYFNIKKYDLALDNFQESGQIFKEENYLAGTAYNIGNVGMVYAEQGKDALAEQNMNEAINMLEEMQDYYPISIFLTYMADIYVRKDNIKTAISYAKKSLQQSIKYNFKKEISDANLKLSELYDKAGDKITAYKYYKDHIIYRDSVQNVAKVQQMADLRTDFEVSQKQIELNLKDTALNLSNQQKENQRIVMIATAIALFLIGLLAIGLFRRNKFIQRTKKIIEEEKNRSDSLLLNILPEETAQELKTSGKVKAKRFESVTVLFSDFKGFTSYSNNLSPEVLVETIGFYFSQFDEIIEKHGLEKIKTIGDAYMCAGGLPFPSKGHAEKMVKAALEITEFVAETKKNEKATEFNFDVRIGINTGPVVAGVVGAKKFAYDIWGDTVNIASRMESNSEPGKINISENTYEIIKNRFDCEYRGELEVKNKGMMKMYFINGIKA